MSGTIFHKQVSRVWRSPCTSQISAYGIHISNILRHCCLDRWQIQLHMHIAHLQPNLTWLSDLDRWFSVETVLQCPRQKADILLSDCVKSFSIWWQTDDMSDYNMMPGAHFDIKTVFPSIGIPIIKMRQPHDGIIFIMGIPALVRHICMLKLPPVQ